MNLGQLQTQVESNLGRTDKGTVIIDGVNHCLKDLAKRHAFRDLRTSEDDAIVTDDSSIALSANAFQVVDIRLIDGTNSYPLQLKDRAWVINRWPNVSAHPAGRPIFCYLDGTTLNFVPKSNGSYTLRSTVYSLPTDLVLAADAQPIRGADYAVVCYATAFAFDSLQQFVDASVWRGRYEQEAVALITADRRTNVRRERADFLPLATHATPEYWNDPFVRKNP